MRGFRPGAIGACAIALSCLASASAALDIGIGYLRREMPPRAVLSGLDPIPEARGIDGAQLGLADNETTGGFLGHEYRLDIVSIAPDGDLITAARDLLAAHDFVVLDMPAEDVVSISDIPAAGGKLLFNAGSRDETLRGENCRRNTFHTILSQSMRADALMQVFLAKRWSKLALIVGANEEDRTIAESYRLAARKFGLKLVSEAEWVFDTDVRRAANREVPLLTQKFKDHDVVLVADAHDDFARYIEHNTWEPRPVAGGSGLMADAWAPVVEQWGATQLNGRFRDLASRDMTPEDYAAWAAVRVIGEAVTRTNKAEPEVLRDYILSDAFELAAFQGRPLSFRNWDGQMRQPVPVFNARAQVAATPLEGFEHPRNPLDTLGTDQAESDCNDFEK